jgi:hypothetical protein
LPLFARPSDRALWRSKIPGAEFIAITGAGDHREIETAEKLSFERDKVHPLEDGAPAALSPISC